MYNSNIFWIEHEYIISRKNRAVYFDLKKY